MIALLVQTPLPPNFQKQIKMFSKQFNRCEIDIISPHGNVPLRDYDINSFIEITPLKRWILNTFFLFFYLLKYLSKDRPKAIMNMSDASVTIPSSFILCKIANVPLVVRLGAYPFDHYLLLNGFNKFIAYFWTNILLKWSLETADSIITMGPYAKKELIRIDGIPKSKIVIIPPYIEKERKKIKKTKIQVKKELGLPEDKKIILFVGRLTKLKGIDLIEKIANDINKFRQDINFCIIGKGIYHQEALNKLYNVKTIGFIQNDKMYKYYQMADLLILPSKTEGVPNVILEALINKTPVVASNVGEIPWIVTSTFNPTDYQGFLKYIRRKDWILDTIPDLFNEKEYEKRYSECLDI